MRLFFLITNILIIWPMLGKTQGWRCQCEIPSPSGLQQARSPESRQLVSTTKLLSRDWLISLLLSSPFPSSAL